MIRGTTVSVCLRERASRDGFGNDVVSYLPAQPVGNVLVSPGGCQELDSTRPEGVRVAYTLHFPKGWSGDLRGARVALEEPPAPSSSGISDASGDAPTWDPQWYRVVGDPRPYMDENCPTPWNMPVEVEAVDG